VDAAPSPVPNHDAQLVLASWPAFRRAVAGLGPLPAAGPVNLDSLREPMATRKQVVAALRVLGLVDGREHAHFRLRRLSSRSDYTAVTEALAERFPHVAAAIATGDPNAMRLAVDGFDAPSSSKERFWRFVREAHRAAGESALPPLAFSPPAGRPPPRRGRSALADDPVARQSLEAELAAYQEALVRLLSIPDLDGATVVSDRLRELRNELRQHARQSR
jgi:hypothetical protein